MRVVIDTNVFISGVFFGGPPFQILKAWRDGRIQLLLTMEILEEYDRVSETLSEQFPGIDLDPVFDLLAVEAETILAPSLPKPVCDDPEDDKFLACALAGKTRIIISGDKHLLKVSGYQGIAVIRPREFVDGYLRKPS